MMKATQPPAGTTGIRAGALQRGFVLLWSVVVQVFIRIFGRRHTALPTPVVPAETGFAVIAEKPKYTRHSSRDRMYSSVIVDELIEKLRRQNGQLAFLTNVYKSTSDAVVVADLSGKITMFNKGAENIFELDETMALGDNLFRLCTDSTPDGPRIGRLLVENKRIENLRSELVGVAGKRTSVLLTVNFVEDEGGEPIAIVAVIKDNSQTERLLAEVTQKK